MSILLAMRLAVLPWVHNKVLHCFIDEKNALQTYMLAIDLKVDNVYHINNAYTQATDGYLRVYAERIEPSNLSIETVDKENNVSLVFLERRIE